MKNKYLFLTVLEAENLGSGSEHDQVKALFWVTDFLLNPHMAVRARKLFGAFYEGTNMLYSLIRRHRMAK